MVALGLAYNLLTKYTSFIAVRHKVVTRRGAADVAQPQPLPAGVEETAVGTDSGDEPELVLLALFALSPPASAGVAPPREDPAVKRGVRWTWRWWR